MSTLHVSTEDPGVLRLTCQNCGKGLQVPVNVLRPGDRFLCPICGYTLAVVQAGLR